MERKPEWLPGFPVQIYCNILSVSKQVTRIDGELVVTEPKTKNSIRRVALSQQAVDILVREH